MKYTARCNSGLATFGKVTSASWKSIITDINNRFWKTNGQVAREEKKKIAKGIVSNVPIKKKIITFYFILKNVRYIFF